METILTPTQSNDVIQSTLILTFDHRVIFSQDVFNPINSTLIQLLKTQNAEPAPRVLVILDQGLTHGNPDLIRQIHAYFQTYKTVAHLVDEPMVIPGGEGAKSNPEIHTLLVNLLNSAKLCRHSYVVVAGGGAVLDAVCYAASIVHRGIRQIRIPTTVLAQTDAGIGIKNGIDAYGKKNFLGTFHPPHAVINDSSFLESLDMNHWRSGTAEAIKVALIRDPEFFDWIEANAQALVDRNLPIMKALIRKGAEHHLHHIATCGDPFEKGSARPLDFGHWSAHKLEQLTHFEIGHGNAVAIGIALDTLYAEEIGLLGIMNSKRILNCLVALGFQIWNEALASTDPITGQLNILQGVEEFREHLGGRLSIPLIRKIGKLVTAHVIQESALKSALTRLALYRNIPTNVVDQANQYYLNRVRSNATLGTPPSTI